MNVFTQTNCATQDSSTYKANIDADFAVLAKLGLIMAGDCKGLHVVSTTGHESTRLDFSADYVVLADASGNPVVAASLSGTVDTATVGAAWGVDASYSAGLWHFWAIGKPDGTLAVLLSKSTSAPALPSGYTFKALLYRGSGIYWDQAHVYFDTDLPLFEQRGRHTTVAQGRVFTSGPDTSLTDVSCPHLPIGARRIAGTLSQASGGTATLAANATGKGALVYTANGGYIPYNLVLTTPQNIAYYVNNVSYPLAMYLSQWEIGE